MRMQADKTYKAATAKKEKEDKEKATKKESTYFNRFLGDDEVAEHTRFVPKQVMTQEDLDEAYNTYFQGNDNDFRSMMKTPSHVAQFTSFLYEEGLDPRLINQMLKTLI